ncbi:MAG: DUF1573 domain-containing protein [Chloroflexi bacterium]|nr:DUF1573 domain-containing protein [Chloroflexota bacterium]
MSKNVARQNGRPSLLAPALIGGAVMLALLAVGLVVLNSGSGGGGGTPQLSVDRERIDFGKVPFNKMVRAEFKVQNTGDGTLVLDSSAPIKILQGC